MPIITVIVSGPQGSGKSRLINIARHFMADTGLRVIRPAGVPMTRGQRTKYDIVFEAKIKDGCLTYDIQGESKRPDITSAVKIALAAAWSEVCRQNRETATPRVAHPGYLVWNPSGPHRPGFVHKHRDDAITEAKRLADTSAGVTFFVLQPLYGYRADRAKMVMTADEIPLAKFPVGDFDLDDEIPF